jgi:glutamate/tyrosine decarboxylase-like PLP-dependent enzyme
VTPDRAARPATEALAAWFLGPGGENAADLEQLAAEAIRDHVAWRRAFHPEDGAVLSAERISAPGAEAARGVLAREFRALLEALKRDVPFYSGRYLGHMLGEQTLAAQLGYLAAMLYNPNNVAAEVSPVTTRLEVEVAEQLAAMIGYPADASWGHLTSGGTIANFEALWIARSIRYHGVALALAAAGTGVSLMIRLPDGTRRDVRDLSLWQLLNLEPTATLDADRDFHRLIPEAEARAAIDAHSLATIGYQDYSRQLTSAYGDALSPGVVLVASTAHYSWEKITRALGIGGHCMVAVPVDSHARMDPAALWNILQECAASRTPVLALVSVCGSTEEGAVDQLDQVAAVRARAAAELGLTFHWHADACFGGYAASVTRGADGMRRSGQAIRAETGLAWPSDGWVAAMTALEQTDSVTIDPHKLGYIPYPAGAFLLRDRRARSLVAIDPPYLTPASGEAPDDERFLGRWILEGSKPGAAAAAVWLSHRVVPLDVRGYGTIIARAVAGAHRLHAALSTPGTVLLPAPDLSVVNWIMLHPTVQGLAGINAMNEAVYRLLSPGEETPSYYITRTRLTSPSADGIVQPLLGALGVTEAEWRREGLVVLRAVVMTPYLVDPPGTADHCAGLVAALQAATQRAAGGFS